MEYSDSRKYKIRLTIIIVIIIISAFLSTLVGKAIYEGLLPTYLALDDAIETLETTSDEDYREVIMEKHPDLVNDENLGSRSETLEAFKQTREAAEKNIFRYGLGGICASFYLAFSGIAFGVMVIVILIRKIMCKVWEDLKKWILVIIPTLIILLLFIINPTLFMLFFGYLGMAVQLPFLIYTIVKYVKLKKAEDKDDIIEAKNDDVKEDTKEE